MADEIRFTIESKSIFQTGSTAQLPEHVKRTLGCLRSLPATRRALQLTSQLSFATCARSIVRRGDSAAGARRCTRRTVDSLFTILTSRSSCTVRIALLPSSYPRDSCKIFRCAPRRCALCQSSVLALDKLNDGAQYGQDENCADEHGVAEVVFPFITALLFHTNLQGVAVAILQRPKQKARRRCARSGL